jgi:membrane-associated phospholipid phosphatase
LTFVVLVTCAAPYGLPAQAVSPLRFKIGWTDGVIVGTTAVATLLPVLWPHSFPYATCAPCDPSHVWGIDRGSVGPVRAAANVISYGTSAAETGLGLLLLLSARHGEGSGPFWEDAAVVTQAVSVTAFATMALKLLVHRPRPLMYVPGPVTPDAGRGFPSSHTSISFAVASAYASILHRRGLAGKHKMAIATLFTVAAATGVLRVVSREHFPTDVVAGAVLGFGVGWFVPKLHAIMP